MLEASHQGLECFVRNELAVLSADGANFVNPHVGFFSGEADGEATCVDLPSQDDEDFGGSAFSNGFGYCEEGVA